jgi:hypothetical protein
MVAAAGAHHGNRGTILVAMELDKLGALARLRVRSAVRYAAAHECLDGSSFASHDLNVNRSTQERL